MAKDKDININFKTEKVKEIWLGQIANELRSYAGSEKFLINLLKVFKILHWIEIDNEDELSFNITLSKIKNKNEKEILLDFLSNYSKVSEIEGRYYLE